VSLLPFLLVTFTIGGLSLLTRPFGRVSAFFGLAGLGLAIATAALIGPDKPFVVAGGAVAGTAFARVFLMIGSVAGVLLCLVAMTSSLPRTFPGATLVGLGGAALALGVVDTGTAVAAATAGAAVGILLTLIRPVTDRGLVVAARELRALVVAGALGLAATAAVAGPLAAVRLNPELIGLAYLAFAVAVAIRLGAIPFHLWAARVADAAPEVGLPLIMAWGPAAFAAVALAWADGAVAPLGQPLGLERLIVVAIGAVSIGLGTAAAATHDDLEHIVGYSIAADAGVIMLGIAVLDPAAWEPTRLWLLAFVAGKSAFAAWAAAMRATFSSHRLSELRGWARKAPVLALALVAIVIAGVGWPGMAIFSARASLISLAVGGPLATVLLVAALGSLLYYGRLFLIGLLAPSATVLAKPVVNLDPRLGLQGRIPEFLDDVRAVMVLNRAAIAGAIVLMLASVAVAVSGGGLGVREAAAGLPPEAGAPGESFTPANPFEEPSFAPVPGPSAPAGSPGPDASIEP
jgi:formate hydrogenlyase subunit 3/multisubunit Na+/H+ antiporter MnhD subunit